jgi:hypothetical protein
MTDYMYFDKTRPSQGAVYSIKNQAGNTTKRLEEYSAYGYLRCYYLYVY